jgi:hypothetical protein
MARIGFIDAYDTRDVYGSVTVQRAVQTRRYLTQVHCQSSLLRRRAIALALRDYGGALSRLRFANLSRANGTLIPA